MKLRNFTLALLVISTLAISCGSDDKSSSSQMENKPTEFNLVANDQMQYNLKNMVVKAGQKVIVNFENAGTMPKETMGHNFILLKPGVDLASFAAKAVTAKGNDYIPTDENQNIVAHSKLLGPGEKTVVEFNAPEAGTYKFICSFPGHYITMQGNFIVR